MRNHPVYQLNLEKAQKIIQDFLKDGPMVAEEIYQEAAKYHLDGYLKDARKALGVISFRPHPKSRYYWKYKNGL